MLRREFLEVVMKEKLVTDCDEIIEILTKALNFAQTPMRKSEMDFNYSPFLSGEVIGSDGIIFTIGTTIIVILQCKHPELSGSGYLMNNTHEGLVQLLCKVHGVLHDCYEH